MVPQLSWQAIISELLASKVDSISEGAKEVHHMIQRYWLCLWVPRVSPLTVPSSGAFCLQLHHLGGYGSLGGPDARLGTR